MKKYVLLRFVFCSSAAFNHSCFIWLILSAVSYHQSRQYLICPILSAYLVTRSREYLICPILSVVSYHQKPSVSHYTVSCIYVSYHQKPSVSHYTVSYILPPEAVNISSVRYCQLYLITRSRQYLICPILSAVFYHQKPSISHLSDTVSCILLPEAVNTSSDRYCQLYFTTRSREYLIWPILPAVSYHEKTSVSFGQKQISDTQRKQYKFLLYHTTVAIITLIGRH